MEESDRLRGQASSSRRSEDEEDNGRGASTQREAGEEAGRQDEDATTADTTPTDTAMRGVGRRSGRHGSGTNYDNPEGNAGLGSCGVMRPGGAEVEYERNEKRRKMGNANANVDGATDGGTTVINSSDANDGHERKRHENDHMGVDADEGEGKQRRCDHGHRQKEGEDCPGGDIAVAIVGKEVSLKARAHDLPKGQLGPKEKMEEKAKVRVKARLKTKTNEEQLWKLRAR